MTEFLDYLNKNSGAFTVIFTAVVTIATAVYAVLTYILVKETRLMRQVQTEPKIEIMARPMEIAVNILRLHVKNIGLGPAINIKFSPKILAGSDGAKNLLEELTKTNFFNSGLAYFGPNQELVSSYTQMTHNHEEKLASIIAFDLRYESVTGKKYKETIVIDMSEHKGAYQLGKPHLYSIAHSLEKLQGDIHNITTGFKKINTNVFTAEDRQQEEAEFKKLYEELKNDSNA